MTTETQRADATPPDDYVGTEVNGRYYSDFQTIKRQLSNKSIVPLRHQGRVVTYVVHDAWRGSQGESFLLRPNVTAKSFLRMYDKDDPSLTVQEDHFIVADDHCVDYIIFTEKNSRTVYRISRDDFGTDSVSFRHSSGDQLAVPLSKFEVFVEPEPDFKGTVIA